MAALAEQLLRMGFLKIAAADFAGWDVGGDGQHRDMVAMTVKQTVNQMQVARSAGAGADRQLAGQLRFRASGESGDLFVPGGHPVDGAHAVKAIAQSIEGISGDAPDTFTPACSSVLAMYAATVCFIISISFFDNAFKLR